MLMPKCSESMVRPSSLARAQIGDDRRFEIVEIEACPPEWVGKVHALHAGVTRSRGAASADFLLFADADTAFTPGCIAASLALMPPAFVQSSPRFPSRISSIPCLR